MNGRTDSLIDKFPGRGLHNERSVFKLTKDQNGRYMIKRDTLTLLIYSEEEKARTGFKILRERWHV